MCTSPPPPPSRAAATTRRAGRRGPSPPPDPRNIITAEGGTHIALQDDAGGFGSPALPLAGPPRAGSASAFGSTAPRFHRRGVFNPVAGERLDLPGVGPHSYEAAGPQPSLRSRIAAGLPSPFFRTGSGSAAAAAAAVAAAATAQRCVREVAAQHPPLPASAFYSRPFSRRLCSSATSAAAERTALRATVDEADMRASMLRPTFSRSASRGAHASLSPERAPFPLKPREELVQAR